MEIKDVKLLIKMVTDTDISEFEMESAKEKIRIKRGMTPEIVHYQVPQQALAAVPVGSLPLSAPTAEIRTEAIPSQTALPEKGKAVTSPIVGTFYRSPAPDAAPYVEVGQVVEKGQVFCIVEAMKLMNEIEAEFRCKILKICKENAQPVEFGDDLFIVEPL
jgi:acetyl-CoA carboxylase biotin carboxyl carrier protein